MSADIVIKLERAATWKEAKPFQDAILFRTAADRIRTLEAALRVIANRNIMADNEKEIEIARQALERQE